MEIIRKALEKKAHEFRRTVQKAYIGVHRKTAIPRDPKSPYHNECIGICRKMLENKETVLLVAPISSKRFMKNEKHGICVVFSGRTVEVVNHVYNYTVHLDEKTWDLMIEDFNYELESRRIQFESEISKNIKYSLKTILKSIEERDATK
jgi:hypothetical protein